MLRLKFKSLATAAMLIAASLSCSTANGQVDVSDIDVQSAFSISKGQVVQLNLDRTPGRPVVASIEINDEQYVLELFPHSVRSENFVLREQLADGSFRVADPGPVRTMRGQLRGSKGSRVVGSMLDVGFSGKVVMGNGSVVFVEPLASQMNIDADRGLHVIYRSVDVNAHPGKCGVGNGPLHNFETIRIGNERRNSLQDPSANPAFGGGGFAVAELAVDADFEYFQDWGSSTMNTQARMEQIINIVNNQYESDVGITHIISASVIRTSEPDPYTSNDAFTLLSQFRTEWLQNQNGVPRDVAHLFTGKSIQGGTIGIAWTIGGICTTSAYCLSESDFNNALVCATDLTAHELGHLWNGAHCNCASFTMNPSITCANNFNPTFTIPDIIAHRDSRTCLDGSATPANDNFVDSINVGALPSTDFGTNVNGTEEASEPDLGNTGATVWWFATAPGDGTMTVSTAGSTFDTFLHIYTGNTLASLSLVASNDDAPGGGNQSEVSFPVTAGQRYEIRVGGFTNGGNPSEGSVNLTTSFEAEGPTDFFFSLANAGAFNTSNAEANVTSGTSGSIYFYYDPTELGDIDTGAFFDIQTSTPGVIEFTTADALDFDITAGGVPFDLRWGDAFGETGMLTSDSIDEWGAFAVVSGQGMLTANTGPTFLDEGWDMSSGAFLFGRIDFNVVGAAGTSVDILAVPGATGIVHMGGTVDAGIGSIRLNVVDPLPPMTDFFWSFADLGGGAVNDSTPVGNFAEGSSGSMFLYFDPAMVGDIDTGAFFDLQTSAAGVIEFTDAVAFDFDVTVNDLPVSLRWGDAFGQTGIVTPNMIDEWGAFTIVSGDGMIGTNTGPVFFDEGYDMSTGAFLFGRVDFNVVGVEGDSVDIFTSAGSTGIVNMGMTVNPTIGISTINVGSFLLGDVNCDGVVDLLDVAPFVDLLTNGEFSDKADINMDGVVDLLDVDPFVDLLSNP